MKFTPDKMDVQAVTSLGPGWLAVNGLRIEHSVLVSSDGLLQPWNCAHFEDLSAEHFAPLAEHACEVVILGSGSRLRFVPPQWLAPLMARGIGVETMDTAAACRTYNVLANEGRKVLAALLLEPSA